MFIGATDYGKHSRLFSEVQYYSTIHTLSFSFVKQKFEDCELQKYNKNYMTLGSSRDYSMQVIKLDKLEVQGNCLSIRREVQKGNPFEYFGPVSRVVLDRTYCNTM